VRLVVVKLITVPVTNINVDPDMLVTVVLTEFMFVTVIFCPDKLLTNVNPLLKFVDVKFINEDVVNVKVDPLKLVIVALVAFKNVNVAF